MMTILPSAAEYMPFRSISTSTQDALFSREKKNTYDYDDCGDYSVRDEPVVELRPAFQQVVYGVAGNTRAESDERIVV
jgi:hypothetical protein